MFKRLGLPLAAAAFWFGFMGVGRAQVTTATFYALVADPTGAAVPGATVTLVHGGTGATSTKTTDTTGEAAFDFLRVGEYTLTIEAQGFKRYQSIGMELLAGQNLRRSFGLELGATSETVRVEATSPLLNTVDAQQQESLSRLQVTQLPLARRNYSTLLTVATGVTFSTASGNSPRLNGLGKSGTNITVDGTDASSNPEARMTSMYQGFSYVDTLSVEAVEEVQTIKGVIPAEYGQTLAGNVNLITKSGSNQFHGSLFENFQAEELNARNQFLSRKTPLTFNQFGASGGGPIRKDKVFLFGAYEGYRESAFQQVNGNTPTQALRDQMTAANPEFKRALDSLPLPNQPIAPGAEVGFFLGASATRAHDNHGVVKGDIRLTSGSNLAVTYTRGRPYRVVPTFNIGNDRSWQGYQERGTASYVMGRSNWNAETRFGYNLSEMDREDAFWNSFDSNRPESAFGGRRTPSVFALGFVTAESEHFHMGGPVWTLEEKYARHSGQHSLKFGAKYSRRGGGRFDVENSQERYENKADLLANIPSRIRVTFGNNPYSYRSFEQGFFAQDDWRVSPKLVINLGIRYDYFSKFVARPTTPASAGLFNLDGLRDDRFTFGPLRDPSNPIESDGWANLGPRFGFSYNPDGKAQTVIRGGFGTMFSPLIWMNFTRAVAGSSLMPFRAQFSKAEAATFGFRYPVFNDDARKVVESAGQIQAGSLFKPDLEAPYSMNVYLGVQRTVTSSLMFESAFVGNRGVKFTMIRTFNPVNRVTGVRPNPKLGEGDYIDDSQNTIYYSWQSSLRKRYSRNLTGAVHYTWGKALSYTGGDLGAGATGDAIGTVQDFFNWRAERGPSTGDITHYMAASAVYELPGLASMNRIARSAIGGWQVSGIFTAATGEPLLITQPSGIASSRPDYIGGSPIMENYRGTLQYLNRAAFRPVPQSSVSAATLRPGNVGNGAVRGPGRWNVDLSLAKNFPFSKEGMSFQFRADAFNFFNHTNFNRVDTGIDRNTFGRLLATSGARAIQLNARLSW